MHKSQAGVVLHGVDWATYEKFRDNDENRRLRMTYEGGTLEMMSPLGLHEDIRRCIAKLIEQCCRHGAILLATLCSLPTGPVLVPDTSRR